MKKGEMIAELGLLARKYQDDARDADLSADADIGGAAAMRARQETLLDVVEDIRQILLKAGR